MSYGDEYTINQPIGGLPTLEAGGITLTLPATMCDRLIAVLEKLAGETPAVPGLLTTKQVAQQLGKSERDVQRLVRKGKLRKVPNLGRTARFRQADVDRLLVEPDARVGRRRL